LARFDAAIRIFESGDETGGAAGNSVATGREKAARIWRLIDAL
jgi:hypothetical protein